MKLFCAWCVPPRFLKEKEPLDDDTITHGIKEALKKIKMSPTCSTVIYKMVESVLSALEGNKTALEKEGADGH